MSIAYYGSWVQIAKSINTRKTILRIEDQDDKLTQWKASALGNGDSMYVRTFPELSSIYPDTQSDFLL
jgi:hypothetical protein